MKGTIMAAQHDSSGKDQTSSAHHIAHTTDSSEHSFTQFIEDIAEKPLFLPPATITLPSTNTSSLTQQAGAPSLGMPNAQNKMHAASSRVDETMAAIKSYIIDHELMPGDVLPTEQTLCDELGASRSSIREAVRKLEALHIVQVTHGKGTFVGDLSLDPLVETLAFRAIIGASKKRNLQELRDVIQVRRSFDLGAAEEIVARLHDTKQPELEQIIASMNESAQQGDAFLQQDIVFHYYLLSLTDNHVLVQLAHSLWLVHMAVLPQLGLAVSTELDTTAHAHQKMLDAAIAGDAEQYKAAVYEHYRPIEAILDQQELQ